MLSRLIWEGGDEHKEREKSETGAVGAPVCCFDTECGSSSWRPDTLPATSTKPICLPGEMNLFCCFYIWLSALVCASLTHGHVPACMCSSSLRSQRILIDHPLTCTHLPHLFFSPPLSSLSDAIYGLFLPSQIFRNSLSPGQVFWKLVEENTWRR